MDRVATGLAGGALVAFARFSPGDRSSTARTAGSSPSSSQVIRRSTPASTSTCASTEPRSSTSTVGTPFTTQKPPAEVPRLIVSLRTVMPRDCASDTNASTRTLPRIASQDDSDARETPTPFVCYAVAMGRSRLDAKDLRTALDALAGWGVAGDAITATFAFERYDAAVAFAVRVALYAQRVDHHPDLLVQWGKVTVTWTTHDAGGVTRRDVDAAAEVSQFYRSAT
ncbi:MAG: phhB [Myxococcaceae bacterium]|nr:phhB [Myxococcaceae bacterium]